MHIRRKTRRREMQFSPLPPSLPLAILAFRFLGSYVFLFYAFFFQNILSRALVVVIGFFIVCGDPEDSTDLQLSNARESATITLINRTGSHPLLIVLFCEVSVFTRRDSTLVSFFWPVRPVKEDHAGRKDDRLKISILAIRLTVFFLVYVSVYMCVYVFVYLFVCRRVLACPLERVRVLNVR